MAEHYGLQSVVYALRRWLRAHSGYEALNARDAGGYYEDQTHGGYRVECIVSPDGVTDTPFGELRRTAHELVTILEVQTHGND